MADNGRTRRVGPRRRAETPASGNDEESGGRESPISPLSRPIQHLTHSPSPTPTASTSRDGATQKPPQGPSIALVRLQKRLNAKSPRRIQIPSGNPRSAALPSPLEGRHGGSAGSSRTVSPIGDDAGRHSPQSPREPQQRNTPYAQAEHPPLSPGKPREFVPSTIKSAADDLTPTTQRAGPVFDINTNRKASWTPIPDLDGSADADLGMAGNPWHNPQLHQVLDLLQVAVMSSRNGWRLLEDKDRRPGRIFHKHSGSSSSRYCGMISNPEHVSEPFRTPLPDEYRGLVSRLIEAVPALERRIQMAEARAGRATEERLHDLALYESAVDEWDRRETEYKREIHRLEVLLAHETMGGMETVALARSTSVVNRGDSRKFTGRMRMVGEKVRQSLGGRPSVDDPKSPSDGPRARKAGVDKKSTTGPTRLNQPYLGDRRKIVDEKHDVRVSKSLLTQPKAQLPTPKYGRVRGSWDSAQSPAETMANMNELLDPSNPAPSESGGQARIGYDGLGKQSWKSNDDRLSPDSSESDSPDSSSSSDDEDTVQGMTNEQRDESEDGLQRAGTMTQAKYNSSMHAQQTQQLGRQLSESSQEKKRFSFEPGEDQIRLSPTLTPPDSFGSVNHPIDPMAASSSSTVGAMPNPDISAKPDASHLPGSGSGTAPSLYDGRSVAVPDDTSASATTIRVVSLPSSRQGAAAVTSVDSGESSVSGVLPQPSASNCREPTNHGPGGRKDVGEVRGHLEDGGDYFGYYQGPSSNAVMSRFLGPGIQRPVEEASTAPSTAAAAIADGSTSIQMQSPPPKKSNKSKGGVNAQRSQPPPSPSHPQAQTPPAGASEGGGAGAATGAATGATTLISAAAAAAAAATRGFASASARAASGVLFSAASRQITSESEGGDTPRGGLAGKVP
ncbi:hypothetical protein MAPG_03923 [Magnaporthiopsis poae ATCC 64411]|uniref:Uncharacterized protein n=1 Tax=Magnaporthiopsis poae (strain ATCC 64411 / 73-15) TaxID=644358 RepID=A0A0C4DVC1_MAGP6|nr:hypothetical protein MAPG_03923 [Magnaporthiopsis poae ATCC 64411]